MRKTLQVDLDSTFERDAGKTFLITEMSSFDAERWALRAFLALAKAGVDVPENIRDMGLQGLALLGMKAIGGMQYDDAAALLDAMWKCIIILPDKTNHNVRRPLIDDDVEEVRTRLHLRAEVFKLHTGFSMGGEGSNSKALQEPMTD